MDFQLVIEFNFYIYTNYIFENYKIRIFTVVKISKKIQDIFSKMTTREINNNFIDNFIDGHEMIIDTSKIMKIQCKSNNFSDLYFITNLNISFNDLKEELKNKIDNFNQLNELINYINFISVYI